MKSRVKTWQVQGIWSQQLEHKQFSKRGTEPGVWKNKRTLLASHTRCKCSMETTHNSVKVKLGIKVLKLVESQIGLKSQFELVIHEIHIFLTQFLEKVVDIIKKNEHTQIKILTLILSRSNKHYFLDPSKCSEWIILQEKKNILLKMFFFCFLLFCFVNHDG